MIYLQSRAGWLNPRQFSIIRRMWQIRQSNLLYTHGCLIIAYNCYTRLAAYPDVLYCSDTPRKTPNNRKYLVTNTLPTKPKLILCSVQSRHALVGKIDKDKITGTKGKLEIVIDHCKTHETCNHLYQYLFSNRYHSVLSSHHGKSSHRLILLTRQGCHR